MRKARSARSGESGGNTNRRNGAKEITSVTTCAQCGQPVRSGSPVCGFCGARLVQAPAAPFAPAPVADDGMPEWMRSFHAGMASPNSGAVPGQGVPMPQPQQPYAGNPSPQISAGSLMSDDALPDWLRGAVPARPQQPPTAYAASGLGWGMPGASAGQPGAQFPQQGYAPELQAIQPQSPQPPRLSAGGNVGVAASKLFDESALPDWLRQPGDAIEAQPTVQHLPSVQPQPNPMQMRMGQPAPHPFGGAVANQSAQGFGGAQVPPPAAAFPSLDSVGAAPLTPGPHAGFSAAALIDGGALPPWLSGSQSAPSAGAPSRVGGAGMAAQSLIDEQALPEWLRAQPATPQAPVAPQAGAWPNPAAPQNLPVPSWMQPTQGAAPQANISQQPHPFAAPPMPPSSYTPSPNVSPAASGARPGAVSASAFVDEGALPSWLRSQSGMLPPAGAPGGVQQQGATPQWTAAARGPAAPSQQAGMTPVYGGPAAQPGISQFSASDLIDPQAVPGWVRGQASGPNSAGQSFSSTAGWTSQQATAARPAQPASPSNAASASSFGWGAGENLAPDDSAASVYERAEEWDLEPEQDMSASRSDGAGLSGKAPRGRPIADHELPPWLQGMSSSAPGDRRSGASRVQHDWGGDSFAYDGQAQPRGGDAYPDYGDAEQFDYEMDAYQPDDFGQGFQGESQGNLSYEYGQEAGAYEDGYDPRYGDPYAEADRYAEQGYAEQGYDEADWDDADFDDHGGGEKRGWRKLFGRK